MKICPICKQHFNDKTNICPTDGEVLDDHMEAMVGQTLDGQYFIEALLGQGGMGAVFRAKHTLLGDQVAIKVMPSSLSSNPEYQRRFLREGKAARRFTHPNVVGVHDLRTTSDGMLYMVMEYVQGNSLSSELKKRRRFTPEEAVKLLSPIGEALDIAHSLGIIHRDIKPDNIMVGKTADGLETIKLLDLGIAKMQTSDATALTIDGQILGTPHYMSPEQWNGEELDGRSDIYSLGITLYELVAGRKPFEGRTLESLACQHALNVATPLNEVIEDTSPEFAQVIARMMEKTASKRPATCRACFDELRNTFKSITYPLTNPLINQQYVATMVGVDSDTIDFPKATNRSVPETVQETKVGNQTTNSGNDSNDTSPGIGGATLVDLASRSEISDSAGMPSTGRKTVSLQGPTTALPTTIEPRRVRPNPEGVDLNAPTIKVTLPATAKVTKPKSSSSAKVYLAVVILVIALGFFLFKLANNKPDITLNTNNPTTSPTITPISSNIEGEKLEMMRYWLEVLDEKTAKFNTKADVISLANGQRFKFQFTTNQPGYLYIVGPGEKGIPTTFLTAKPLALSGLKTNTITTQEGLEFPKGDHTLELDQNPGVERYSVVFSATPLVTPSFFSAEANHPLTSVETSEWENFRAQLKKTEILLNDGAKPYLSVNLPKKDAGNQQFIFDINIPHK